MTSHLQARDSNSDKPARICYQSFVDRKEQQSYMLRLQETLTATLRPKVRFVVHGVSPPDRYLSPLTEFRYSAQTRFRGGIRAQQQGYDAFVLGHFQEPGLV